MRQPGKLSARDEAVSADIGALSLADAEVEAEAEQAADDDDNSSLFDEPLRPDCDICMLPLPIAAFFQTYMPCCGKTLCCGCTQSNQLTIIKTNEKRIEKAKKEQLPPPPLLELTCSFCRTEMPEPDERGDEQILNRTQKRVEMKDSDALLQLSHYYRDGQYGLSPDEGKYLELIHQAASLGSADAHSNLGNIYRLGKCGVSPDIEKARSHFEAGAKRGHVTSRHNLGAFDYLNGNKKTAVRHWRLSAAAGYQPSVDLLIKCFQKGLLSKESLEKSIRAKHEACEAIRSEDRDLALEMMIQKGQDVESYY